MLVFHCVVHQCVDDHFAHDLKLDAQHVDVQMIYVLGELLLVVRRDQCVALKCVTYRLLALMNENVRILELQYFHQLAFQHVA
jgi:hypothetical protein